MKKFFLVFLLAWSSIAMAADPAPACEKVITVRLSQTSYTLNVWKHIRNYMNAVEFQLPVSCPFYDSVRVGDDLLRDKFRWGSLAVHGSFGTWNLQVIGK